MTVSKALQFAFQISYEYFQKPQTRFSIKIINYDLCVFYFYLILYIYIYAYIHTHTHTQICIYTYSVTRLHSYICTYLFLEFSDSHSYTSLALMFLVFCTPLLLVKLAHKNFTRMFCTSVPARVM